MKQILIGMTVSLAALAGAGIAMYVTVPRDEHLASLLPADAVLAYAEFPAGSLGADLSPLFSRLAPALPPAPGVDATVTAVAVVRASDGTEGWLTHARSTDGSVRINGSNPALETLLREPTTTLASDATFNALKPTDDTGWIYLAYPRLSSDDSPFASLLALETPIAITQGRGITLRLPLRPTPRLAPWQERPTAVLPLPTLAAPLPSWHAMERLSTLLTDDARAITETLARTFVDDVANGLSVRHDIALLLHEPSLLQVADAAGERVFSLEGEGRSNGDVDRVLRTMHQHFASARGTGKIRTVTMEGFTLETLTQEREEATVERQDGEWVVLETRVGEHALASAHNGRRFVVTTAPDALFAAQGEATAPTGGFSWTPEAAARVAPLWPTLRPASDTLEWRLTDGPGYVEWTLGPLEAL